METLQQKKLTICFNFKTNFLFHTVRQYLGKMCKMHGDLIKFRNKVKQFVPKQG